MGHVRLLRISEQMEISSPLLLIRSPRTVNDIWFTFRIYKWNTAISMNGISIGQKDTSAKHFVTDDQHLYCIYGIK